MEEIVMSGMIDAYAKRGRAVKSAFQGPRGI
jgi:hypothetical protein